MRIRSALVRRLGAYLAILVPAPLLVALFPAAMGDGVEVGSRVDPTVVRVCGRSLCDDNGPFLGLGVSYFQALRHARYDRPRLTGNLALLASRGFNYVRVLSMVNWDGLEIAPVAFTNRAGHAVAAWPDYWDRLRDLLDLAAQHGLRVELTIFADAQYVMPDRATRLAHLDGILKHIAGREAQVLHLEVANEAWQNGFPGERGIAELREFTQYLAERTAVPVAITSNDDTSDQGIAALYRGSAADLATVHFSRDTGTAEGGWLPVRDCYRAGHLPGVPPVSSNEPIGPGSSVGSERDPIKLCSAAIFAYLAGLPAYVFHSSAGVYARERFEDTPGLDAFRHLRRMLPGDLARWSRNDGLEPTAPFTAFCNGQANRYWPDLEGATNGCHRNVGSAQGHRFVCLPMGILDGGVILEARRPLRVQVIDPLSGAAVSNLTLAAGSPFALPRGPGAYLLDGRFLDAGSPETSPASRRANYARPFEPPTHPAFIALPPGAIEPAGWLRDWCLAARDGFTGHMDEYDDEFKRAWAPDHRMTGEGLFWYKGAWPYEGGGYWFDGLTRLGFALHDNALIEQAQRRLYAVADRMNSRGLLFLWWLDRDRPADRQAVRAALEGWPLWACGLLGRAMSGFYAGSGDPHILRALEQAYGSDPDGLRSITGNLSNPWPAYDAYCWTGNPGIGQALDNLFKKEGAALLPSLSRYQAAPDLKPGSTVDNAHVVEFLESTTPWAVAYLWTGDRRYLEAAVGWHDLLERVAMQPHGVPVSDEWYGPTGAFRGSETCDVAGYVWSQICLLSVTGEGRMADRLERAFFNAGPAAVSRDFKTHVYFQSPNRFASGSPDYPHGPRASGGDYRPKHSPLCCTAALNRIVPWFVTHLWMATPGNGLAATGYSPCTVTALVADRIPVTIVCRTDYPFRETIEMSVRPTREAAFPLDLRIPGWCESPTVTVNGAAVAVVPNDRGFTRIERSWKSGDTVRLCLPMAARVERGRDAAAGPPYDGAHAATRVTIPAPASTRGVPYASVAYGPLLFALPIPDTTDPNTPDPGARWRFALDVQNPGLTVERTPMPDRWEWPLGAPLRLQANAVEIPWNPDPKAPRLPLFPATRSKPAQPVALVPYGCTKFRISMFPVTAEPEVKPADIRRILFLGNSITLHGPNAEIGWTGNWGMAASAEDKDYVHLVSQALAQHTGSMPEIRVRNIADFERNFATYDVDGQLEDLLAFDPDLVVLAIGENVAALTSDAAVAQFKAAVLNLLRGVLAKRHPLVVVRSCFWPDPAKDRALAEAAGEANALFVDAGPLGRDAANAARSERTFTHDGVGGHPGDRGMEALADAIVHAVLQRRPAPR